MHRAGRPASGGGCWGKQVRASKEGSHAKQSKIRGDTGRVVKVRVSWGSQAKQGKECSLGQQVGVSKLGFASQPDKGGEGRKAQRGQTGKWWWLLGQAGEGKLGGFASCYVVRIE